MLVLGLLASSVQKIKGSFEAIATTSPSYIRGIDGLRAFAVSFVILYHYFPEKFRGGFTGVDIFFVISGFLISRIIINGLKTESFTLKHFYSSRIRRIFPALTVVLITTSLFAHFVMFPEEIRKIGTATIAGSLFSSNFYNLNEIGYFEPTATHQPLLHLWSLAVEEQFYIIWPLFIVFFQKKRLFAFTLSLALVSFSLNIFFVKISNSAESMTGFYLPWNRVWELALGGLLAQLILKYRNSERNFFATHFGFLLIIISAIFTTENDFPGFKVIVPVIGAALIIYGLANSNKRNPIFENRLIVYMGKISYPLYLWHWPVLTFITLRFEQFGTIPRQIKVLGILLSIVLSVITYHFIENIFRIQIEIGKSVKILLALMVSVLMAGVFQGYSNAAVSHIKISPPAGEVLLGKYPHDLKNEHCASHYPQLHAKFWACLATENKPPEVLILGDSHANQFYSALQNNFPKLGIISLSQPACLPFTGFLNTDLDCQTAKRELSHVLENTPSIKQILVAGFYGFLVGGKWESNDLRIPTRASKADLEDFTLNGIAFLSELSEKNREIFLLADIPSNGIHPLKCLNIEPTFLREYRFGSENRLSTGNCGTSYLVWKNKNENIGQVLELISRVPNVLLINPAMFLCGDQSCKIFRDKQPVYFDTDHLSNFGASYLVSKMFYTDGFKLKPR